MEASEHPTGPDAEPAEGVAGSDLPPEGEAPAGGEGDAPVASDAPSRQELSDEERDPAAEQAPAATENQDAIIGDPGLRDEQQPQGAEGSVGSADTPVRTSAPPPEAQSGVPLPEDRAAGVQPGEPVAPPPAPEVGGSAPDAEDEPEEGQE